jgi:hypothetical protein
MIYVEDDFLPEHEFSALRDQIPKRYIKNQDHMKNPDSYESIRLTWHSPQGDWEDGCRFLGNPSVPAVVKLMETFKKLNIPAVSYSLWYAYMFPDMRVIAHSDGELRQSNREHTYTCLYYTSDWQPGWGGELVFGEPIYENKKLVRVTPDTIIEPKPNRQVIFSRNHAHEVLRVTHNDPSYIRCALGSGWSSVKDREMYRHVVKPK